MYWVQDYRELKQDIAYLEESLERNKRELHRWVNGDLSKYKLEPESHGAKLEDIILGIEREIAHKMNDLESIKRLVATFEGVENQIAYKRYIESKKLTEIASELNLSLSYAEKKSAEITRTLKYAQRLRDVR